MKQINLYLPSGYLDVGSILKLGYPFNFVIGGRGTGKSYGALKAAADYYRGSGSPFLYMRRTKAQADMISNDIFNPFRPINLDHDWNIHTGKIMKGVSGFYDGEKESYCGVIAALSTFSNFRGFDASDVDLCIFDEFIKNKGERSIKDEGFALKNVYETINRNRELQGRKPLQMICLSNSNAIDNDIFIDFEIVQYAELMIKIGKNQWYLPDQGIAIFNLTDSPISQLKSKTALYKADAGGAFTEMSLENKYEDYDTSMVRSVPLREYKPIVQYGELVCYRHKADGSYYGSFHRSGTVPTFSTTDIDQVRFVRKYIYLWQAYLKENISFESFIVKKYFERVFYS